MTFLIGSNGGLFICFFFRGRVELLNRLTDNTTLAFLGIAWFLQIIVNSLAVYLRSAQKGTHGDSFIGFRCVYHNSHNPLRKIFANSYFFLGYLSSYFWGMPWIVYIRKK